MRQGHDGTLWNHCQINVSFSMLLSVTELHHTNRASSMRDRVSPEVEPPPFHSVFSVPSWLCLPHRLPPALHRERGSGARRPHGKEEGGKLLGLCPSHLGSSVPPRVLCWAAHRDRGTAPDSPHTVGLQSERARLVQ